MSHTIDELTSRIEQLERQNEELLRARDEFETRERNLLAIIHNTPAPIYLKDTQLRYLLVNRRYEELAHVAIGELLGKDDHAFFPAEIAELFQAQDREVIEHGMREFEESIVLPDGLFTFITVKFPVFDNSGTLRAVGGFCTDITARKNNDLEREALIGRLQAAQKEVATLRKILPICSSCKQIRDDTGYWSQLETYLREHAELEFTHSVCPACEHKLYGAEQWFKKDAT